MQPADEATKKCPYCAETIKADAIVCRFCGRDVAPQEEVRTVAKALEPAKSNTLGMLIVLAVGICLLMYVVVPGISAVFNGTATPKPKMTAYESAWYTCTVVIENKLGLSFIDAQDYNPGGVVPLPDNEYQVDVYYAKPGSLYRCIVLHRSDGRWEVVSLSAK